MLENNVSLKNRTSKLLNEGEKIFYLRGHRDVKRQVKPPKLCYAEFVGPIQAHSKTGTNHLWEGTQGVDVGQAFEEGHLGVQRQLLVKVVNFLQELSALITLLKVLLYHHAYSNL